MLVASACVCVWFSVPSLGCFVWFPEVRISQVAKSTGFPCGGLIPIVAGKQKDVVVLDSSITINMRPLGSFLVAAVPASILCPPLSSTAPLCFGISPMPLRAASAYYTTQSGGAPQSWPRLSPSLTAAAVVKRKAPIGLPLSDTQSTAAIRGQSCGVFLLVQVRKHETAPRNILEAKGSLQG